METLDKQIFFRKISSWGWRRLRGSTFSIAIVFLSKRYQMPIAAIKMKQLDKSFELKKNFFFYSVLLLFFFSFCSEQSYYKRFSSILFILQKYKTSYRGVKG
jgi:hypothetical protein